MDSELIIALGTLVATIILGILAQILPWYRSPQLEVDFKNREPFCQHYPPGYWIRLEVRNKGQKTAHHVTGSLIEIRRADYTLLPLRSFFDLNWCVTEAPVPVSLRPSEKSFLDLVVIREDNPDTLRIQTSIPAQQRQSSLPRDTYFFRVEVYAEDAKPAKALYHVTWPVAGMDQIRMRRIRGIERDLLRFGLHPLKK